jgi:bifunctional non-homologous end joining protein LigD
MPTTAAKPQREEKQKQLPWIEPIRPERKKEPFDSPDWLFELKYDGFRGLLYVEPDGPSFISRNRNRMKRFDDLALHIARKLNAGPIILDGEIVCVDETGRPIFDDLFQRRGEPVYMAFDLLWLQGQDLRSLPLAERKARLKKLLGRQRSPIAYVQHLQKEGKALFAEVERNDLEGIVAKMQASPYTPQTTWYKIKNPAYSQATGRKEIFEQMRKR